MQQNDTPSPSAETFEEQVANSEHAAIPADNDGPQVLYCTHCGKGFPNAERVSTVELHATSGECSEYEHDPEPNPIRSDDSDHIEDTDIEATLSGFMWGGENTETLTVADLTNKERAGLRRRGVNPSKFVEMAADWDQSFIRQYRLTLDHTLEDPETRRYQPGPGERFSAWGRENLPDWFWRKVDDDKERAAIAAGFVGALFAGPGVLFATSAEFWSYLFAIVAMLFTAATSKPIPVSLTNQVRGVVDRSSRSTVGFTNPDPQEFVLQGGLGIALGYLVSLVLIEAGVNTTDLLLGVL